MPTLEDTRVYIAIASLAFAVVSFGMYLMQVGERGGASIAANKQAAMEAPDPAEVIKGLAALVEALAKAGPALWSLIGAALFLVIAALSAGAFQAEGADDASAAEKSPAVQGPKPPAERGKLPVTGG